MSQIHENTLARRQALQAMFQQEFLGYELSDIDEGAASFLVVSQCPEDVQDTDLVGEPLSDYAAALLKGVVEHLDQIDGWISATAQNWTIERMPIVDRNIIRLCSYEVAFCEDIPTSVAINEAVEIAKAFGGDESPKFVNGVLGRIASFIEEGGASEEPAADEPVAEEPAEQVEETE